VAPELWSKPTLSLLRILASQQDIEDHSSPHGNGKITEIKPMNGFGFIEYEDAMDARDIVLSHTWCHPFIVTHTGLMGRAQSEGANASINAPVGVGFRKCHRSPLSSHTGQDTHKKFGTAVFGSSGFANIQRLPDGKVSSDVCHEFTACSLQTVSATAGHGDLHAANSDGGARRNGILNAIYATRGNPGRHTSRFEEYGDNKSHCGEDAFMVCDAGSGTVDLISYTISCRGPHEAKSSFPNREARENTSKNRVAALQPRTASFDTIRKLYGVKDRAGLARFKMERFLNEPDDDCCREPFWESSMESEALEDNLWVFGDLNMEVSAPGNRLPIAEDSYKAAKVASSLIPGASTSVLLKLATTSPLKAIECPGDGCRSSLARLERLQWW
jgi:hypothetical protein